MKEKEREQTERESDREAETDRKENTAREEIRKRKKQEEEERKMLGFSRLLLVLCLHFTWLTIMSAFHEKNSLSGTHKHQRQGLQRYHIQMRVHLIHHGEGRKVHALLLIKTRPSLLSEVKKITIP